MSSMLLNSENYTDKDEILHGHILDCDANTGYAIKYLELGTLPIHFEIVRRKKAFLQYILNQEKAKIYKWNSVKNDFVQTDKLFLREGFEKKESNRILRMA